MKLADYLLKKSENPAYSWIVFLMTVCESIFLFIPPEVFMTPPIIANRRRAMPTVIAASLGSILGGAIAYLIGAWLFDSVGMFIINNFASIEKFAMVQEMFIKHGILIIVLTAITPIPYKLIAICAGFMSFPILVFLGVSAVFRTTRFAVAGTLLYFFQERANTIVRKYFWPLVIGAILATVIGIAIVMMI